MNEIGTIRSITPEQFATFSENLYPKITSELLNNMKDDVLLMTDERILDLLNGEVLKTLDIQKVQNIPPHISMKCIDKFNDEVKTQIRNQIKLQVGVVPENKTPFPVEKGHFLKPKNMEQIQTKSSNEIEDRIKLIEQEAKRAGMNQYKNLLLSSDRKDVKTNNLEDIKQVVRKIMEQREEVKEVLHPPKEEKETTPKEEIKQETTPKEKQETTPITSIKGEKENDSDTTIETIIQACIIGIGFYFVYLLIKNKCL